MEQGVPPAEAALRTGFSDQSHFTNYVVDFSDLAQSCKTYGEFIDKMTQAPEQSLRYFGVAICGPKKKVNQLTGSMPLLR